MTFIVTRTQGGEEYCDLTSFVCAVNVLTSAMNKTIEIVEFNKNFAHTLQTFMHDERKPKVL